jgi:hypothetical protein
MDYPKGSRVRISRESNTFPGRKSTVIQSSGTSRLVKCDGIVYPKFVNAKHLSTLLTDPLYSE